MNHIKTMLRQEKVLVSTGIAGFLAGIFCLIYIVFRGGSIVPPEGDILRAVSFDFAIGLFALTTAFLMPFANFSRISGHVFRFSVLITFLISILIETTQHFRGIDPRFSSSTAPFDITLGSMFGLNAILIILTYLFFTWQIFRPSTIKLSPNMVVAIRYGMLSVLLSFAVGFWITSLGSRFTGMDGNIIWLHGLGFHGVQLIPILAWLLGKSHLQDQTQKSLIHVTGFLWSIVLLSIGIQTYNGQSVFELSPIMLVGWISAAVYVILLSYVVSLVPKKKDLNLKKTG
ncbi:hypothetical protein [Chengkuizengella axinellae]|uniref:DUF998 domain-containing protein n=1 Tax=Chengkuizengella axinellae TaxID=3064388 RepID=A0ABT9J5X4_9BACL|nr:hypothetical protein [Chengkuizengella sp. 2205SS18-9]MDP5276405.1 hypothetical protein [Chengkuizengella sp. 2205SS18-9]